MKYKLLLIAVVLFTSGGYFIGTLTNSDPNDTLAVLVLSIMNIFFIAMMLTSFRMLKNIKIDSYSEGTRDMAKGVDKVYGEKGVEKVLDAAKEIAKGEDVKPHVHNHSHY